MRSLVATPKAKGEFLAIFDADFVPPPEFLKRCVALLVNNQNAACMQGRWAHLNRDESWLTRAQALGIDGHFAIEQGARAWNGLLMNFQRDCGRLAEGCHRGRIGRRLVGGHD